MISCRSKLTGCATCHCDSAQFEPMPGGVIVSCEICGQTINPQPTYEEALVVWNKKQHSLRNPDVPV